MYIVKRIDLCVIKTSVSYYHDYVPTIPPKYIFIKMCLQMITSEKKCFFFLTFSLVLFNMTKTTDWLNFEIYTKNIIAFGIKMYIYDILKKPFCVLYKIIVS